MSHEINNDINILIDHLNSQIVRSTDLFLLGIQLDSNTNTLRNMRQDPNVQKLSRQNENTIKVMKNLKHHFDNDIALHRDIITNLRSN